MSVGYRIPIEVGGIDARTEVRSSSRHTGPVNFESRCSRAGPCYAIAQRLEQVSRGVVQVPEGSLYPALHRLENRGFLSADWKKTETGREAKFYRLTRKGRKQLEAEAVSWQRLTEAIGLILGMGDGGAQ